MFTQATSLSKTPTSSSTSTLNLDNCIPSTIENTTSVHSDTVISINEVIFKVTSSVKRKTTKIVKKSTSSSSSVKSTVKSSSGTKYAVAMKK